MPFKNKFLILVLLSLLSNKAKSQDPHFTQYYAAPLLMNPALTGFFNGDVRISSCYRSQWASIQYPYTTGVVSADANVFKGLVRDGDIMGVGLTALFDKTNNGGLKTNTFSGSFSYHKLLDANGINRLGIGAMITNANRVVDYSKLTFGQQLTPIGFNPNLPTGEQRNGFSSSYVSYAVGLMYSAITDESSFYCGGSLYHFNNPVESFGGNENKINPRLVVNAGGYFGVGEMNKLFLSAAYMQNQFSNDLIFGAAFSKALSTEANDNYNFLAGGWYRYNDAVSPYVGIEYKNFRGALSYDVNVSALQTASNLRGGFELSFSYLFTQDPEKNAAKQTLCPKGKSQLRWFGY